MKLYEARTKTSSKVSTSSTESKILELDLPKTLHSTGSYGYASSGKRIMVEIEVDGKKEQVPAIVSLSLQERKRSVYELAHPANTWEYAQTGYC